MYNNENVIKYMFEQNFVLPIFILFIILLNV